MAASVPEDQRFCFIGEWYDLQAELVRSYYLFYYPVDSSVELFDIKNKRTFLKRTTYEISTKDIRIGATLTIYARPIKLAAYGDERTRSHFEAVVEKVLAVIPGAAKNYLGAILDSFLIDNFAFENINLRSGNGDVGLVTLELSKRSGLSDAQTLIKKSELLQLAGVIVTDCNNPEIINKKHGNPVQSTKSSFEKSTLCLIKPHSIAAGYTGLIIQDILDNGFSIINIRTYQLEVKQAEEFLEVYKGVLPEYHHLVHELVSGRVIALQIGNADKEGSVTSFRDYVGPYDPQLAKHVRPDSLRARFGEDKIKNVVHCTDLPEDGAQEIEYFFELL